MTLVAAAVVPTPPLLVPEVAGGSAHLDDDLRAACDAAVRALLDASPDRVVVVGGAPTTGVLAGSWDWRGFGVASPPEPAHPRLPLAPAIGAWLLDRVACELPREVVGVAPDLPAVDCAALGARLVAEGAVALLVCGDGSACRDVKAPGHLDERAAGFDAEVARALATGGVDALLGLDRGLATELLAAGAPSWQVLAGAARAGAPDQGTAHDGAATARAAASYRCRVLLDSAPYGVGYVVATWV